MVVVVQSSFSAPLPRPNEAGDRAAPGLTDIFCCCFWFS